MKFFKTYLLPGFMFQSVVIGGGYATGRELVEFFFEAGPIGGLLGLVVAGVIFGLVSAVGFELARKFKAFDYRHFCKTILGRGWVTFEFFYFFQLLLVLSVIGSASGEIASQNFGVPSIAGTLALLTLVGILTFKGTEVIKKVLAGWSILLYGVYILLFILAFSKFGGAISETYRAAETGDGWLENGVLYTGYNLASLPLILYAVAAHNNRRETLSAGLICGAITVIPAMLFFIAMMGQYPQIGGEPVPATFLMAAMQVNWLNIIFQIIIFGTFVETGTAMIHAVNERIEGTFAEQGKHLPRIARPIIAIGFLLLAVVAAETFGIINLIANGYGYITVAFIAILIVPMLTVGIWKIAKNSDRADV